jgi:hypothetical protein
MDTTERDTRILTTIAAAPGGVPLADLAVPLARRLRAVADACRIVERAHARGIVHGALSARAILVDDLGETHVVGWAEMGDPRDDVAVLVAIAREVAPALTVHEAASPRALAEHVLARLDGSDRAALIRRQSRAGIVAFLAYMIFGPAFLWLGAGAPGYAAALLVLVAANVAVLWRQGVLGKPAQPVLVAAANVALIALIGRVTSPFLLAPGIAAVTTMAIGFSPVYEQGRRLAALAGAMTVGVLLPWFAERLGWLSTTTTATRDGLVLSSPGLHLREGGQTVLMVLYTVSLIAAGAVLAFQLARAQRMAR